MSKERWLQAYQQVEAEQPEGTPEDALCTLANEREADLEAAATDDAWDRHQESCTDPDCPWH